MSSMIDVTFLLLAYFLLTTIVSQREDQLSPNLAIDRSSAGTSEQDLEPQIVEVALRDGEVVWSIGARSFSTRDDLLAALRDLPKGPGLFVRVLDGPTVAAAAAAIQCGRDAGFKEVTYVPVDD